MILLRYDPQKKGVIYYDFFCDDVYGNQDAGSKSLDQLLDEMYKIIRKHYDTFDGFLKAYDRGKPRRGKLLKAEFVEFMNNYKLEASTPVIAALMDRLKLKNNELLYQNIRDVF